MKKILILSDTHFLDNPEDELHGWNVHAQTRRVLELAFENDSYDALLLTGDLSQFGTQKSYELLKEVLSERGLPIYTLPGNHDLPDNQFKVFPRQVHIELEHNWSLLLLNSWKPDDVGGELPKSELDILKQTLKKNPQRHFLIGLHHPPVSIGVDWLDQISLQNPQAFWNELGSNVKAILFGHSHCGHESLHREIPLMCTPSPWVQFKLGENGPKFEDIPGGCRVLEFLQDGKFETRLIRLPEQEGH